MLASAGFPIITGTREAATGYGNPADVKTPTTDVLNFSCEDKPGGGKGQYD
jgi:hypothetical protein